MSAQLPYAPPSDEEPASPIGPMSFDAYLRLSEQADRRYEYMNGFAHGLAGATLDHDTVTLNVATRLRERSRERGCVTTSQGFQVLTPRGTRICPTRWWPAVRAPLATRGTSSVPV